jgi:hypothetical protein
MNALSKEQNVQSSLKKYFVDTLGEAVTFDTSLSSPDIRVQGAEAVKQWYNVDFGEFGRRDLAEYMFDIYCLSRQDPEGDELARITDEVIDLLVDSSMTDGMKRIPLYDISDDPWVQIGAMVVQDVWDAPVYDLVEDETKVKSLSVRLRWGAAI